MNLNRMLVMAAVVLLPVHSYALTTSPGKTSVHVSSSGTLDGGGNITPNLTAEILKGKAKQVVEIVATISVNSQPDLDALYLGFVINGIQVHPSFPSSQCDPSNGFTCTMTSTFWLDIDTAELANPGLVVGQPLVLTLSGGNAVVGSAGAGYSATFSARMIKK